MSPARIHDVPEIDNFSDGASSIDGSTSEPAIPSSDNEAKLAKCHWYGHIMFNAIIAEKLFSESEMKTSTELDSDLIAELCDFPYAECIRDLAAIQAVDVPSDGSRSTSALMRALKTKIGVIMGGDDAEKRQQVIQLLQGGGTASSAFANSAKTRPLPSMAMAPSAHVAVHDDAEKQLPMYTMRLHEWCQKDKRQVNYTHKHLTVDPPQFEAAVAVDGRILKGYGRNKTKAHHEASKEACAVLHLDV